MTTFESVLAKRRSSNIVRYFIRSFFYFSQHTLEHTSTNLHKAQSMVVGLDHVVRSLNAIMTALYRIVENIQMNHLPLIYVFTFFFY